MRIAKVTLQRWHHRLRKHSPEVEAAAGLDIKRHQLLPNDPGSEQGKATGVGNQEKMLFWEDVIYTDETTVQIETHRRTCCYKKGQKPKYKPKPKHPIKVHVWAGISYRGWTSLCIFEGKMNAPLFVMILERCLVPFLRAVYPDGHHFVQDNDPKHCSNYARRFYEKRGISWWPTPPESPDLNPIENLWHELKEFIRREVKPKTKQELIDGIKGFWGTVSVNKCQNISDICGE